MALLYSLPSVKRLPQAYCYWLLRNTMDYGVRLKQHFLCRFSVLFGFHSRYPTSRHQHAGTYISSSAASSGNKKNSRKQFSENTESYFRQSFIKQAL